MRNNVPIELRASYDSIRRQNPLMADALDTIHNPSKGIDLKRQAIAKLVPGLSGKKETRDPKPSAKTILPHLEYAYNQALNHSSPNRQQTLGRLELIEAAARLDHPDTLRLLSTAVQSDPNAMNRKIAISALTKHPKYPKFDVLAPIMTAIRDEDPNVRLAAFQVVLEKSDHPESWARIALEDADEEIRQMGKTHLEKSKPK